MKKTINKLIKPVALITALTLLSALFFGCASPAFSPSGSNAAGVTHLTELENQHPGISFQKRYVDDIAVIDVFNDNGKSKPTMFIIHGYGGSKKDSISLAVQYASNGYFSVIFDAYGHGERTGGDLKSFPEVMAMYPYDIEKVVGSLKEQRQADLKRMGMLGISMGACAIYKYCTFAEIKPKAITPFIGTPYYEQLMDSDLSSIAYDEKAGRSTSILTQQYLNQILADSSPYKNYQSLKDIAILMQNGGVDTMITPQGVNMLYHDLKGIGAENVELIIYPELWHEINDTGWDNAFAFMEKHLK